MEHVTIGPVAQERFAELLALLDEAGLPKIGLEEHIETALAAEQGGALVGSAALELYGAAALLRSVAVAREQRGRGIGEALLHAATALARTRGVVDLYLLTETAAPYFAARGFAPVERAAVSSAVQRSVEFISACPATAQAMHIQVHRTDE